jgi:hypothetical protein
MPTKDFLQCSSIELSCENGMTGKRVNWSFPINHAEDNSQDNGNIAQLYAADLISRLEKENINNNRTTEIVKLSVGYGIMNSRTSFVVVDDSPECSNELPVSIIIPQFEAPTVERFRTITALSRGEKLESIEMCAEELQQQAGVFKKNANTLKRKSLGSVLLSFLPSFDWFGSTESSAKSSQISTPTISSSELNKLQDASTTITSSETTEKSAVLSQSIPSLEECGKMKLETDVKRMDTLLQFKKIDGSFSFLPQSLLISQFDAAVISSFSSSHGLSEDLVFNLWILKWLTSEKMKNERKYVMIVRNLEKWVRNEFEEEMKKKSVESDKKHSSVEEILPMISL